MLRRHGWETSEPPDKGPHVDDDPPLEPWEDYDWDNGSFCSCGAEHCIMCNTQASWWAQLNPNMPFEENGLIHLTEDETFEAICGSTFLKKRFDSYNQAQVFAEIARNQHKAPTCIDCVILYAQRYV